MLMEHFHWDVRSFTLLTVDSSCYQVLVAMFLTEVVEVMMSTLIHFMPFVSFYTPGKHQKTFGFPNAFNGYRKDSGMKCCKMKLSLMFFFFRKNIFKLFSRRSQLPENEL